MLNFKIASDQQLKLGFYDGPLGTGARGLSVTIETAQKIIKHYPSHNFVGIGRASAWLIEIAKLIDKDTRADRYQSIAFSGNWYQFKTNLIKPDKVSEPEDIQIAAYRKYLKSQNFTPQTIIKNTNEQGRQTVLIDFLQTGLGLYSFTDLLLKWALELETEKETGVKKELLLPCLILHDLSQNNQDQKNCLFDNLSLRVNQFHSDVLKNKNDGLTWEYLAEGSQKPPSIFPVTEFHKDQWLNPPVETEENLKIQQSIRIKIFYYLKENGLLP